MQSLMEQRRAVGGQSAEHELPATLTAHQWELLDNVLTILPPEEELQKEISSSTATAADTTTAITAFRWLLQKQVGTDHGVAMAKANTAGRC